MQTSGEPRREFNITTKIIKLLVSFQVKKLSLYLEAGKNTKAELRKWQKDCLQFFLLIVRN